MKNKTPKDMQVGATHKTNNCGSVLIYKYDSAKCVTVIFEDTGTLLNTTSGSIRQGCIKDVMKPSVFSIGFLGLGNHKRHEGGKPTKAYETWRGMFNRCYNESRHETHPTYIGCTVCEEWHNFQSFSEWFGSNYIKGFHLDKDSLIEGNKVYSPDSCVFISPKENSVLSSAKKHGIKLSNGEVIEIYNLSQFCRDNNIEFSKIKSALV